MKYCSIVLILGLLAFSEVGVARDEAGSSAPGTRSQAGSAVSPGSAGSVVPADRNGSGGPADRARPGAAPSASSESDVDNESEPTRAEPLINYFRFMVAASIGTGEAGAFQNGNISSPTDSTSVKSTFKTSGVYGVYIGARASRPHGWGMDIGAGYEFPRDIKELTVTGSNGVATVDPDISGRLSNVLIFLNAIYRWDEFYIPFGVNYSIPTIQTNESGTSFEVSGGTGFQAGVGYLILNNFGLELALHAETFHMKETQGTYILDYNSGAVADLRLGAKYNF